MSKSFEKSLISAALEGRRQQGVVGSSKTVLQVRQQAGLLAEAISAAGFGNLKSASQIKQKHIEGAFEKLKEDHSLRTCQNYARTLRYVLAGSGVDKSYITKTLTNEKLGIGGASRDGTKIAIPEHMFRAARAAAAGLADPRRSEALPIILDLQRFGGYRIAEARIAGREAAANVRMLDEKSMIAIADLSKGGRPRWVNIQEENKAELRAALVAAAEIYKREGNFWPGANGRAAAGSLSRSMRAIGLKGVHSSHSLRYAFTAGQVRKYRADGYTKKDALAKASGDLGHGDGRGDYVKQVYLKGAEE